jgi:SAM-dependent methyltransferase
VSTRTRELSDAGLWQLVESDGYRVDLDIWAGLAAAFDGEVLDLGCGIGRVSHHLSRLGHPTTGIDCDPGLVEDFNRTRPEGSRPALTVDATGLLDPGSPLRGSVFDLVIAPQQLLQVLGGHEARMKLLVALPELTAPGGLAAFAICERLPETPVDYPDVPPDLRELDGWVHSSQPVSIETGPEAVTAVRNRKSLSPAGEAEAGLEPAGSSPIPATDRHMASTLVLARRPTS